MQSQLAFYEELERQFDETRNRLQSFKQELGSYEKIMSLLKGHINENKNVQKQLIANKEDERKLALVKESHDKLQTKYERFKTVKVEREEEYKRQVSEKNQLEAHLISLKAQIAGMKKLQDNQNQLASGVQVDSNKPEVAFDYDVETINFLNECNWNLGESCDRKLAETLLSCFPSGTFLVRSSKTKQNSFALSVVAKSKVRHCLIDKIGEEYCFHPSTPQRQTYTNLCGLVMDYRHKSLVAHNPELDTHLIYPVLSQLKKTSKNPSGIAQ